MNPVCSEGQHLPQLSKLSPTECSTQVRTLALVAAVPLELPLPLLLHQLAEWSQLVQEAVYCLQMLL
jgi:hypothetical protein